MPRRYGGQLVLAPFNFAGSGQLDDTETFEVFFIVPEAVDVADELAIWVRFEEFTASAKSAASGGGATSGASSKTTADNGGGQTSSSASTPSGGGATSGSGNHTHRFGSFVGAGGTGTKRQFVASGANNFYIETSLASDLLTFEEVGAHTHSVPAHTHSAHDHTVADHGHGMAHTHSTPNHTHDLVYGIFKETLPGNVNVRLRVFRKPTDLSEAWRQVHETTLTKQEQSLDLADVLGDSDLGPGLWRLAFDSTAGQPNGGRLGVTVSGYALGTIASV
jgi:hypothetical protein